jgi:ABC-2 type transport system permease protein
MIVVALLLGAVLATGIGFLLASLSKDLNSIMAWGIPILIILTIPALGIMIPGFISDWVKLIPSYYFVTAVDQAANFGAGWSDIWQYLAILVILDVAFIWLGIIALRRRLW